MRTAISTPIRRRAADERGSTIIAALTILTVTLFMGAAAVTATVNSVNVATHGKNDSQALQAADTAADLAWNRLNTVGIDSMGLPSNTPCLSWSSSGTVTAVASTTYGSVGWCPSNTVAVPNTASASYQYTTLTSSKRYIVGTGTVGNVTRRVELVLNQSSSSAPLFGTYSVQSHTSLDFVNSTLVVSGGVRTDGSVKLEDTAVPCHVKSGVIQYGGGQNYTTTNNAGTCGTPGTEPSPISFPAVTVPTTNDDGRLCNNGDTCSGSITWNSTTKSLTLQNTGDSVTLKGNTYVFCNLTLMNGTLNISPTNGQPVAIYLDTPANCTSAGIAVGSQDLDVQNTSAWIKNNTGLGAKGLQIYIAGGTTAYINNSSSTIITGTIYAPSGTINMINSAQLVGAVEANTVSMTAQAQITYDSTAGSVSGASGGITYTSNSYYECPPTAGTGNAPDNSCP